jgi:hypothetical protein
MDPIDQLAEQKIQEAMRRGDFDDLPGSGRPLMLDDLALVPEHLRAAYRLLKNAGYLPPELYAARELREAEDLLARIDDSAERRRQGKRLRLLEVRLRELGGRVLADAAAERYRGRLSDKLDGAE